VSLKQQAIDVYHRYMRFSFWIVGAIAAFLRLFNLGYPHALVFDETYYVKDAWSLSHLGYEGIWKTGSDAQFLAGNVNTFTQAGSFIVHPPLGKWLISLGMLVFGPQNSWAWRIVPALFGIGLVVLLMFTAKRLLGSHSAATLAGLLLAIDGHAIVLSRTALLDGFLAFFVLLAFYFLIRDREDARVKYTLMALRQHGGERVSGHDQIRFGGGVIWARPFLVAMAIALALATSIKWSGAYFALFFGAYVVISELLLRRRYKLRDWFLDGLLSQTLANLVLMVPVYLGVYVANWLGWILTNRGYARGSKDTWWASLWQYHVDIYGFHVNLHTPHSYASNPLTWLFLGRPTSMFYVGTPTGADCPAFNGPNGCASAITALGNPFIWWGALAAMLYLLLHYLRRGNRTEGLILLGVGAGYLPWLLYMQRTIFQFYAIAFLPFSILALVYVLRSLWYRRPNANTLARAIYFSEPSDTGREITPAEVTTRWRKAIVIYLVSTAAISVFFLSIWWGVNTPYWFWLIHMWLPTWI